MQSPRRVFKTSTPDAVKWRLKNERTFQIKKEKKINNIKRHDDALKNTGKAPTEPGNI